MKHQGPWKGSVLHRQGSHGQLKFSADRVTHSTSLWRVVYFSFPVGNVSSFGFGQTACPGFWLLPWWSSLGPNSGLMAVTVLKEDSFWKEETAYSGRTTGIASLADVYWGVMVLQEYVKNMEFKHNTILILWTSCPVDKNFLMTKVVMNGAMLFTQDALFSMWFMRKRTFLLNQWVMHSLLQSLGCSQYLCKRLKMSRYL